MSLFDRIWMMVSHHLGTKIISIVIAVVLWVVVLGSRSVEVIKEIPVELITPAELVASNDIPEKIAFKLAGPKAFLRAILDRREDPIRVNLAGAKAGLVTYRFFADNIRLPIGVKVVAVTPPSILIKLEPLRRREMPVKLELLGAPPEGYQIAKAEVVPRTVRVKGAESRIDSMREISTVPVDLSQVRGPLEVPAQLDLARQGFVLDGAPPVVRIQVVPVQANYKIKNVDVRVLSSLRSKLEESVVSIFVRIDPERIKTLDRQKVYAEIDVQAKTKGRYIETVKVHLPEGVGLVRVVPEKLSVTLY